MLPKEVFTFIANPDIKLVKSIFERCVTRIHYEKDYSESEKVDHVSLIRLFKNNLWGHVGISTFLTSEVARAIFAFNRASKSKICYFDVE